MEQLMSSFEQFGLVVQYYVAVIALNMYILVNSNIMYRGGNSGALWNPCKSTKLDPTKNLEPPQNFDLKPPSGQKIAFKYFVSNFCFNISTPNHINIPKTYSLCHMMILYLIKKYNDV